MSITTTAGSKFPGQFHRLATRLRFANDLDIEFGFQQLPKPLTNNHVIFRQQNSDTFHKY